MFHVILALILIPLSIAFTPASDCVVSTFAGGTSSANADGVGTNANFQSLNCVAVDHLPLPDSFLVVTDRVAGRIRRISRSGIVTTWAGATAGDIVFPGGISVLPDGSMFVVEMSTTCRLRSVSPTGVITTFAGGSSPCLSTDGKGTMAAFNFPKGIWWSAMHSAFIVGETGRIRFVSFPDGDVRSIVGSGVGPAADGRGSGARVSCAGGCGFAPAPWALDGSTILFSDFDSLRIKALNLATFDIGTWVGNSISNVIDGVGTAASFRGPLFITADGTGSGGTLVADSSGRAVRRVDRNGVVMTLLGQGAPTSAGGSGIGVAATFSPYLRSVIAVDGVLFVMDNTIVRRAVCNSSFVVPFSTQSPAMMLSSSPTPSPSPSSMPVGACRVSPFVGGGAVAADGAVGTSALLGGYVRAVLVLADDTILCTLNDHTIIRVDSARSVTAFAGSNITGYFDAIGTNAKFSFPTGIAYDQTTNSVVVSDTTNYRIRRISLSSGSVMTLAGSGSSSGVVNGLGVSAVFRYPYGGSCDAAGNFYVTELYSSVVRLVTPAGAVSTVIGVSGVSGRADGPVQFAQLASNVITVDVDPSREEVLISDGVGLRSLKTSWVSTIVSGVGAFNDGDATTASFLGDITTTPASGPYGIARDRVGGVVIADTFSVRRLDADRRTITTLAGSGIARGRADGFGVAAGFNVIRGIGVLSTGAIVVGDMQAPFRLRVVECPYMSPTATVTIGASATRTPSVQPTPTPTPVPPPVCSTTLIPAAQAMATINCPYQPAVLPSGVLLFVNRYRHIISALTPSGALSVHCGTPDTVGSVNGACTGGARFHFPHGIVLDSSQTVAFVSDSGNNAIRVINLLTNLVSSLSGANGASWGDGFGSAAAFNSPANLALDAAGFLYIADRFNHRIRRVDTSTGWTTTIAGSRSGYADGFGAAALFNNPQGVAVTPDGATVYVADTNNARIRVISVATGLVSTLAGSASFGVTGNCAPNAYVPLCVGTNTNCAVLDGIGTLATFSQPLTLTWTDDGSALLVGDHGSNRVRVLTPAGSVSTLGGVTVGAGSMIGPSTGHGPIWAVAAPPSLFGAGVYFLAFCYEMHILNCSAALSPSSAVATATPSQTPTPSPSPTSFARGCVVSTLAGGASVPNVLGVGTAARFSSPAAFNWAPDNVTLLVTDTSYHMIKTVSTITGAVAFLSGSGAAGYANGNATSATYNAPRGICSAPDSTVFVVNSNAHAIQAVSLTNGSARAFVGLANIQGNVDGFGSNVRLQFPRGLACAPSEMYLADGSFNVIRRITYSGLVSTIAGGNSIGAFRNAVGTNAQFNLMNNLRFSLSGDLLVGDTSNNAVRLVTTATGSATTIVGSAQAGTLEGDALSFAALTAPRAAIEDGFGGLYIAENHRIRYYFAGRLSTIAGTSAPGYADGFASSASFNTPFDIIFSPNGSLLVLDISSIRTITCSRALLAVVPSVSPTASPTASATASQMGSPAVSPSTLSSASATTTPFACSVNLVAGNALSSSLDGVGSIASFSFPSALLVNGSFGLIVAQPVNATLRSVRLTSRNTSTLASGPGGAAGLALDQNTKTLYVADSGLHVIRSFENFGAGASNIIAGVPGTPGFADGMGSNALFNAPMGLAADSRTFCVYVADTGNSALRVVTPQGDVRTLAGGIAGASDGVGRAASFKSPLGVAWDATRLLLWVADTGNSLVRVVNDAGTVVTVAGRAGVASLAEGLGSNALLHAPSALALAPDGRVVLVDAGSNNVRMLTLQPGGLAATVATVSGGGASNFVNGGATVALFSSLRAVAVNASGAVFVADGSRIRILTCPAILPTSVSPTPSIGASLSRTPNATPLATPTLSGCVVKTLAGACMVPGALDGPVSTAARFNFGSSVAVDRVGNVFVVDQGSHTVRRIFTNGTVSTIAGKAGVNGSSAMLIRSSSGIAYINNSARASWAPPNSTNTFSGFFLSDTGNHVIRLLTINLTTGAVNMTLTSWGINGSPGFANTGSISGAPLVSQCRLPQGVAWDSSRYRMCVRGLSSSFMQSWFKGTALTLPNLPPSFFSDS